MRIVPFGVDLEMFPYRERKPKEVLTIGYVGRLASGKRFDGSGGRAGEDQRRKIGDLLIVGDGEEREQMERRIAEDGLLERAEFTGAVSYEKTPEYFRQMDVLVVPTLTTKKIREQFGRVIVEAMASGVPVIGSTCGAIPEVIGDAGFIVPENDSEALANTLKKLLDNKELRNRAGKSGRRRVEENFTWEQVAKQIFSIYTEVLADKETKLL